MGIPEVLLGSIIFATYLADTVAVPTVLPVNSNRDSGDTTPVNCYGTLLAEVALLVPASCVYDRKNRRPHRTIKINNVAIGNTKSVVHVSSTWLKKGHPSYNIALVIIPTQQSTPATKLTWSPYSIEQIDVKLKSSTKAYAGCGSLKKLGSALDEMGDRMIPFKCTNLASPEKQGAPLYQTNNGIDEVFGLYNGACTIGWGLKSKKGHCGVRVTKTTFDEICAVAKAKSLTINGCNDLLLTKGTGAESSPSVVTTKAAYPALVNLPPADHGLLLKFCPGNGCCGLKLQSLFGELQQLTSIFNDTIVRQINMANYSLSVAKTPTILYRPKGKTYFLRYTERLSKFTEWKDKISKNINKGKRRKRQVDEQVPKPEFTEKPTPDTCELVGFSKVPRDCKFDLWKNGNKQRNLDINKLNLQCKTECSEEDLLYGGCIVLIHIGKLGDVCADHLTALGVCQGVSDCDKTKIKSRGLSKRALVNENWDGCKEFFLGGMPPTWNVPNTRISDIRRICQERRFDPEPGVKKYFATLYDTGRKIPHWSAYKASDGSNSRVDANFISNRELGCDQQAFDKDYKGSGWSRGHLNPSGIHKDDRDAMIATFTLTNMAPQNEEFNSKQWNQFEDLTLQYYIRVCKVQSGDLYLVTGTQGDSLLSTGKIGKDVKIPKFYWTAGCCVKKPWFFQSTGGFIGSFAYRGENKPSTRVDEMEVYALEDILISSDGKRTSLFPALADCSKKGHGSDLRKPCTGGGMCSIM